MLHAWTQNLFTLPQTWDRFWFSPIESLAMGRVRAVIGSVAAIQFLIFCTWVPQWLTGDGWFNVETGLYMIGDGLPDTGSPYRWSLLFRTDQTAMAWAVCGVGLLASIATALGIGSRAAPLLAWLAILTIHNRAPLLALPGELLIAAGLLYCTLDTGRTAWSLRPAWDDGTQRVMANVARRCIQIHFLLWLVFSIGSMLQYSVWWDGTAVPILSEKIDGLFGTFERTSPWGHFWTHAMVGLQVIAVLTLTRASTVGLGFLTTIAFAMCVGLFAGDWIYAISLIAMATALLPAPKPASTD